MRISVSGAICFASFEKVMTLTYAVSMACGSDCRCETIAATPF